MVLGFFLIPFLIGIPIFIIGILLSVFSFYKKWMDFFVPKKTQERIGQEIAKSYEPYQPALKSMKWAIVEMLKVAVVVFIVLTILAVLILRKSFTT